MSQKKYFSMYDNKIAYTDNLWKSYVISNKKTPGSEYLLEDNRDTITEILLKIEYGSKFGNIIINEFKKINKIYYDLKNKSLNDLEGYGRTFEVFAIAILHNERYEDVINNYIIDGANDGKIDAIYYNSEKTFIYQIKMSTVDDSIFQEMESNLYDYYEFKKISKANTSDLEIFLKDNWEKISTNSIMYRCISKNSKRKENINPQKIFIKFLKNKFLYKCEEVKKLLIPKKKGAEGCNVAKLNKNMLFSFVKANDLIEHIGELIENDSDLETLFLDNVRGYLGENSVMIETLQKEPELFCFYNNGISILGDEIIEGEHDLYIRIKNPKIINGQQTLTNIYLQRNNKKIKFEKVYVPIFIKKVDNVDYRVKIAKFNNTQKKINAIDLLSLDSNIRKIQQELFEKSILDEEKSFYHLMITSSGKRKNDNELKTIYKGKVIKLSEFVKLYSVLKNKNTLGDWKNNYNSQVTKNYSKGFPKVSIDKSIEICKLIIQSKELIKVNKSLYQIADLTIQYLLSITDLKTTKKIIDEINKDSLLSNKKLADAYKSNKIIEQVEKYLNQFQVEKKAA